MSQLGEREKVEGKLVGGDQRQLFIQAFQYTARNVT